MIKKFIQDESGIALVSTVLFSVLFLVGIASVYAVSKNHVNLTGGIIDSNKAFHLAEAGIDRAVYELRASTSWTGTAGNVALGEGEYMVQQPTVIGVNTYRITAIGYVPNATNATRTRSIQVTGQVSLPPNNFFDNALFTSGDVRVSGNEVAHVVNGKVVAGGDIDVALNATGTVSANDPNAQIFPLVDFSYLRSIAESQIKGDGSDNYYSSAEMASFPAFPLSFWFDDSDPDPANWIPNVVYVESDLDLSGQGNNNTTAGGVIFVVGDVLFNGTATADTDLSGNVTIDGVIYSTGELLLTGGGHGLTVLGGIWAGDAGIDIRGNITITYNSEYMDAASYYMNRRLLQITSWTEV